jgi:pimeloyl-ACP methyl ester carboxylesterase
MLFVRETSDSSHLQKLLVNAMKKSITSFRLLASVLAVSASLHSNASEPTHAPRPSVVIVHGAFADGSDWAKVVALLQAKGVNVIAVQNPLTSLADDVSATKRAIDAQPGKVVLVGHSWGGTVITEAGNNDKVAALVYVSAFAPDAGQPTFTAEMGKNYPKAPGLDTLVADPAGFVHLSEEGMRKHFAPDVPAKQSAVMYATQGPIQSKAFDEPISAAAWKTRPSWYVVSTNDHMIVPAMQMDFAKKIGAHITQVATSHVPQQVQPAKVAAVILEATEAAR